MKHISLNCALVLTWQKENLGIVIDVRHMHYKSVKQVCPFLKSL